MSLPSVCSSMCLVKFCRELNCRLHSLQKSCLKSKPTDSLVILEGTPVLHVLPPREDDEDSIGVIFGLDGASSSFTFRAFCTTGAPLAVPVLSLGDGAGLLSMSSSLSSSSLSEGSTASSFTRILLLGLAWGKLVLLLFGVGAVVEELGVVLGRLLLMLYILWTIRMCLFNMS